jgi:hypothetical protein
VPKLQPLRPIKKEPHETPHAVVNIPCVWKHLLSIQRAWAFLRFCAPPREQQIADEHGVFRQFVTDTKARMLAMFGVSGGGRIGCGGRDRARTVAFCAARRAAHLCRGERGGRGGRDYRSSLLRMAQAAVKRRSARRVARAIHVAGAHPARGVRDGGAGRGVQSRPARQPDAHGCGIITCSAALFGGPVRRPCSAAPTFP